MERALPAVGGIRDKLEHVLPIVAQKRIRTSLLPDLGGKQDYLPFPQPRAGNIARSLERPLPGCGGDASAVAKSLPSTQALESHAMPLRATVTSAIGALGDRALPNIPHIPIVKVQAAVGARTSSARSLPAIQDLAEILFSTTPPRSIRRRLQKKVKPCWRPNAQDDLECIASKYGADLASADTTKVPRDWLDPALARSLLLEAGLPIDLIHMLEVYAGTGNFTSAWRLIGLNTGPCIDKLAFGGTKWNLLQIQSRRLLWAVVVVCKPEWLHSGFPCTFWTQLAHMTRRKSECQNEEDRLCELVHVILTCQLAQWQGQHQRRVSLENPPSCASWCMDIMRSTLAAIGAKKFVFDSCAWGHRDPGNGKPYKKAQCIASNVDLSGLVRHCSCGKQKGIHERVEGVVSILLPGQTRRMRRSTYAGAYPKALCTAWARIIKAHVV